MLTGLGSSTLKALRDLQAGAHWGLSGRSGEYAAGNGAAMRIAPLAFLLNISEERLLIRDICNITHKNDEAYVGCLSILYALDSIITGQWKYGQNLIDLVVPFIPDTSVKDNLLTLQGNPSLSIFDAAQLIGCSGHVVESVPISIFAAQKIKEQSFEDILSEVIRCGGDTDTNASMAGQMMGTFIGYSYFPAIPKATFSKIKESSYILQVAEELSNLLGADQS
jgi:ADP-ribosyl-[dinitrogen reductase] hydrolase